ncbi:AAA family ATPase, partial [Lactococcus lactis]
MSSIIAKFLIEISCNIKISFESGMTILTGETGAGKSIIIDAMS